LRRENLFLKVSSTYRHMIEEARRSLKMIVLNRSLYRVNNKKGFSICRFISNSKRREVMVFVIER
jgi:hypothetical protein